MTGLHFLFLQGEPTSFYKRVGDALSALGCRVTRINFCPGDWLYWHGQNAINYRGTFSNWPDFLNRFLDSNEITDIFLCGEQRSYHKVAINIAKSRGIRVAVTDLGYLRPDWITLEREGMNGSSRFTQEPRDIMRLAEPLPVIDDVPRYKNSLFRVEMHYLLFELTNYFLLFMFPDYHRTDNRKNLLLNYILGFRRLILSMLNKHCTRKKFYKLKNTGKPYFLFLMQLEYDYSILSYSPFSSLEEPVRLVIKSFAENSSSNARLVFKTHPLDSGIKNWQRLIRAWAAEGGIADRIDFFDGGDLDQMIKGARGIVTVNSTAGLRALQLGCPVMTLGQAIYNIEGMVDQRSLHEFWVQPVAPEQRLVEAFVKLMKQTILVRGVFFSEPGLSAAVSETVQRLYNNSVGRTLNTSFP